MQGKERASLGDILKFVSGARTIPPRGYPPHRQMKFTFTENKYPETFSCFLHVSLPLCCVTFEEFCENFDKAVLWSLDHYGQA